MKKLSKEAEVMLELIRTLPVGAYITYQEITEATGIPMTKRGKNLLYRMLHKAGRAWLARSGDGVEMDGPNNAMALVAVNLARMDSSIFKTHKVVTQVMPYSPQLQSYEQERLVRVASTVGSIMIARYTILPTPIKPPSVNTIASSRLPHL